MDYKTIDQEARRLVKEYKKLEADLLEIIIEVDQFKVYRKFGYNSLFQYAVQRLGLSESQAYGFINVARKSHEIPKIKESIKAGKLSVSKARRISSVITQNNQDHWINLAVTATQRKVEREVALAHPEKASEKNRLIFLH